MQKSSRSVALTFTVAVFCASPIRANAQAVLGVGVGAASVPRAYNPLCSSARTLVGPALSAMAGVDAGGLRFSTNVDFTSQAVNSVASCVPRQGVYVDSTFAEGKSSAVTAGGEIGLRATQHLGVSLGAGWVPGHESWFLSAGAGVQLGKLRLEAVARRHRASFDRFVREYGSGAPREISRSSHAEDSWGGIVRLLLVTR